MSSIEQEIEKALEKASIKGNIPLKERLRKLLIERKVKYVPLDGKIETVKQLGKGAFGQVHLVRYQGKLFAHKRAVTVKNDHRRNILDEGIKLTDIVQTHPNVQRLFFINLQSFGILIDYCANGSLDTYVGSVSADYSLLDALNWAFQLADALSFLHANKMIHRDVKMQNILLKDHFKTLVLTDYGTATNMSKICKTQEVGTPITMAPEVCLGGNYAEQCDIYSWAIVFWQLLSKQLLPYESKNMGFLLEVVYHKRRPPKLNNCPEFLLALLYRSWHSNRNERPTLSFIKNVLRLVIRTLPKRIENFTTETAEQMRRQWIDEYHFEERYLPNEPRPNNEQSMNIYREHLTIVQRTINLKKEINVLNEKLNKYDEYERLLRENEDLEKKINDLRQ